jgi:hypothetical protein
MVVVLIGRQPLFGAKDHFPRRVQSAAPHLHHLVAPAAAAAAAAVNTVGAAVNVHCKDGTVAVAVAVAAAVLLRGWDEEVGEDGGVAHEKSC